MAGIVDAKGHYGVIIVGAGISGLGMNIQLKRKLGYVDVMEYESSDGPGGTWHDNSYPGAACDIPVQFYSFSFAPSSDFSETSWASRADLLRYINNTIEKFKINNIVYGQQITLCKYSEETRLWTVHIKDRKTGDERTKTCNVLVSAVGVLRDPFTPEFASSKEYHGDVWHSARWNHEVDLTGKDVVIVGNGCSAAQIVPQILPKVKSITQIARSRQTIVSPPDLSSSPVFWWILRHVPGALWLMRVLIFWGCEENFVATHIKDGAARRQLFFNDLVKIIRDRAPEKYWAKLQPDFQLMTKRRIFDQGFLKSLNSPKYQLIQDYGVKELRDRVVITDNGDKIAADVVICSTGFKAQEYLFPLAVVNGHGENLVERLQETSAKMYRGTFASGYPNFAVIDGPNCTTGHSSVIFTSECQINLAIKVIAPILKDAERHKQSAVEVTMKAEDDFFAMIRKEMQNRVWEKHGKISWYTNANGICTALYPFSQVHFWWNTLWPIKSHYTYQRA